MAKSEAQPSTLSDPTVTVPAIFIKPYYYIPHWNTVEVWRWDDMQEIYCFRHRAASPAAAVKALDRAVEKRGSNIRFVEGKIEIRKSEHERFGFAKLFMLRRMMDAPLGAKDEAKIKEAKAHHGID